MSEKSSRTQNTLALVGVIVSLLFVGWEIRQNTKVARAAAIQATAEQILDWQAEVATDEDAIRVFTALRSGVPFAELSPEDKQRYGWIVSATVRIMENRYRQVQMGIIDPEDMGIAGGTSNPNWFRSPYFLEYWASLEPEGSWAPDFLEFFETEVLGIREPAEP
ncbi:MAG: hypothetical protein V2I57_13590 [Xanthomonadales bacterium]|jgi:hypothetical protein|nr:hypothetical protein [Xanthomonadales bacterium]